jgi:membrane associated rhomboid family serine protease
MWAVFLVNLEFDLNLTRFGLYPRTARGAMGIFTIPFLHGSWSHLINNSIPMLVLGWALFKFYRPVAFKTLIGIYILSGIWLWISGRPSYHIGASGVIYGMATFLFISGWIRREKKVAALSLLVAFLYGGMWWGVLPVDPTISWEGHFWGALAGIALAFLYRKQGPTKPKYQWEIDEEKEIAMAEAQQHGDLDSSVYITYNFIPNSNSEAEIPKEEQNNS